MDRHGIEYRAHSPEQKKEVILRLKVLWLQHPELRFGQLISNFFHEGDGLYYVEDYDLIETLERCYSIFIEDS